MRCETERGDGRGGGPGIVCVCACLFFVCVCASDGNICAEAVSGGPPLHLVIEEIYSIMKQ